MTHLHSRKNTGKSHNVRTVGSRCGVAALVRAAVTLAMVFLASGGGACASPAGFGGMPGMDKLFKHLPPIIKKVRHRPLVPLAGEETLVTARVSRFSFGKDYDFIESVTLFYSMDDGETWDSIDMEPDENEIKWTEYIPGAEAGVEVLYYVKAQDSVGNIATEIPHYLAMSDAWYALDDEEFETAAPHDYLAHKYDHEDAADIDVPAYMDVFSLQFGYDDYNFYFRVEFESPVEQGTITPLDAKAYFIGLLNRSMILSPKMMKGFIKAKKSRRVDEGALEENKGEILDFISSIRLWYYAPLVEIMPPLPGIDKLPGVSIVRVNPDAGGCPISESGGFPRMDERYAACIEFEEAGWSYELHDNYMDVTFDREALGPSGDDTIFFMSGNIRVTGSDFMNAEMNEGDTSTSVTVIMRGHDYVVAEAGGEEPEEAAPADDDEDEGVLEWDEE